MMILLIEKIQRKENLLKPLLCQLDSGATSFWITHNAILEGTNVQDITNHTLAGTFSSNQELTLSNMLFPEFHRSRNINNIQVKILEQPCWYDMILGHDLMNKLGIILDFKNKTITWDKAQIYCELTLLKVQWRPLLDNGS